MRATNTGYKYTRKKKQAKKKLVVSLTILTKNKMFAHTHARYNDFVSFSGALGVYAAATGILLFVRL